MTCPSTLTCSMYADHALPRAEAAEVRAHVAECGTCRERIAGLAGERQAIHRALMTSQASGPVPALLAPPTIPTLAVWLGWAALAGWAATVGWATLTENTVPGWLEWLAPDVMGASIQILMAGVLHLVLGGPGPVEGMLDAVSMPLAAVMMILTAWLLIRWRPGPAAPTCLTLCLAVALLAVAPASHAFEVRRDDVRVHITAGETIDDTLVVMSEAVLIEGTVTGDLVVMGEQVSIPGEIGGTVVAMGNTVAVEGPVGGNVLVMGETVSLRGATVAGNLYGMGRSVSVDAGSRVEGNSAMMGEEPQVHGFVGRDLLAMGKRVSVLGRIGGDLSTYGESLSLGPAARIDGDLTATVDDPDASPVPDGVVGGVSHVTAEAPEPSRYTTWHFYVGEVLQLAAAFVCGLVLFHFFPGLARGRLDSGSEVLITAAIGALGLIALPALALACILTLIGAPIGLLGLLVWIVGLYLAGIVVAAFIGRRLGEGSDLAPALSLLIGLGIVYVLVNVPYLGGLVRLVVLLLGLGMIGQWLRGRWGSRAAT